MFNTDKKPVGVGVGVNGSNNDTMFKGKPRPKLERNIDYALPSISSDDCLLLSSSSSSTSGLDFTSTTPSSYPAAAKQRTRSLDIDRLDKNISSRIQGNCPGEFEIICRSLGLSDPEDFAIPAAAGENMKVPSSSSDVFPRLPRFGYGDSVNRIIEKDGSEDCDFLCTPRIQGNCPGEFELICRSLGLSPEDFAMPAATSSSSTSNLERTSSDEED